MTRSFKATRPAIIHDYKMAILPPNSMKKNGAGRHGWGSLQDAINIQLESIGMDSDRHYNRAPPPTANFIPPLPDESESDEDSDLDEDYQEIPEEIPEEEMDTMISQV